MLLLLIEATRMRLIDAKTYESPVTWYLLLLVAVGCVTVLTAPWQTEEILAALAHG